MVEKVAHTFSLQRLRTVQWNRIFHMFYIEPVVFMLLFSLTLSNTIMRNQVIYQTCTVIFHYNVSDCKLLDDKNASTEIKAIETELQPYVANLFLSRTLLESIVPAFCGLFIGSWSDHYGRKPLLIVSMIGFAASFLVTAAICELSSYYVINPWWYIAAAVPHSMLGGNCVFSVAALCFISDITDTKTRPYRMIFMESLFFIGLTSGSLLSSFVYAATSASITIGISGCITTVGTLFVIFVVPESLHIRLEQEAKEASEAAAKKEKEMPITGADLQLDCVSIDCPPNLMNDTDDEDAASMKKKPHVDVLPTPATPAMTIDEDLLAKYVERLPPKVLAQARAQEKAMSQSPSQTQTQCKPNPDEKRAGLFSFKHIRDMVNTCVKPRENHARAIIWLVTCAMCLSIFVFDGVMTVMYLFVREKFHWSVRDYTFYETVAHLVPMIGALIGFLILRKVFRLSVVTLGLLAFFSEILNHLARGLSTQPWHMYLSVVLGFFRSIGGPMCRTIVSNIVPASDLGKIFSIKNVLQSFAPFVAAPLYTLIYKSTLSYYPGLFNFVSAALYVVAFVFMGCVLRIKFMHKQYYAKVLK
ncbi:probable peptidoglycan muropeptide transporter SLC46 [Drosophila sulfurigaster albostrigata]|uniref:probable peptidoglycan muropeptide transporter SLC46 n=1 Tax=Drosophila sulfurigaster albostrigata TaxID=89887 RepID=UPI002D2198B0|nr:probable peptidoglycan muropeptide transporter SLC46 [Drosophila sulfurigaster albostrigata]